MRKNLLLSSLTLCLLAACGGNGGSNPQNMDTLPRQPQNPAPQAPNNPAPEAQNPGGSQQPQTQPPAAQAPNPPAPDAQPQPQPRPQTTWVGHVDLPYSGDRTPGKQTNLQEIELNVLPADGRIRQLPDGGAQAQQKGNILIYGDPRSEKSGSYTLGDFSYKSFQLGNANYRHSQFGLLHDDKVLALFTRGEPTGELPQTGMAHYQGDIILAWVNAHNQAHTEQGKVDALADFDRQRIDIKIASNSHDPEVLQNTIRKDNGGNYLFDNAKIAQENNMKPTIVGYFFGPQGQEIGGTYENTQEGIRGVFGATKLPAPPSP